MRIKYCILTLWLLFKSCVVYSTEYYCPRTDNFLIEDDAVLRVGYEGIVEPYPSRQHEERMQTHAGDLALKLKDCSVGEVECIEIQQMQTNKTNKIFYLFLPKKLEVWKEYHFRNMRLVTQASVLSPIMSTKGARVPVVQVVLWQNIEGHESPLKLTIKEGKGVVYLDGLDFWGGRFGSGEVCILESEKGFFSSVKILKENIPHVKNKNAEIY